MNDFAFVAIMLAFFALAALFVAACDHIIGDDEEPPAGSTVPDSEHEPVAV